MEVWRDIPGYVDLYQVSNYGHVRTASERLLDRGPGEHYLNRYLRVKFYDGMHQVHQLVLLTFVGKRPRDMISRHLNDIKGDARLCNLAYGTCMQNSQDAFRNGRLQHCIITPKAKQAIVTLMRLNKTKYTNRVLAELGDTSQGTVSYYRKLYVDAPESALNRHYAGLK